MRQLTLRDLVATLITAAVVVPFVGYSVRGSMPLCKTPAGWLGWSSWERCSPSPSSGAGAFGTDAFEMVMVTLGVLTLGFATAALVAETVWALLVPAMAGLVLMWALALLHDAGYVAPRACRRARGGRQRRAPRPT